MQLNDDETRIVVNACDSVPLRYKDETLEAWEKRFIAWTYGPYDKLCAILLRAENAERNRNTGG